MFKFIAFSFLASTLSLSAQAFEVPAQNPKPFLVCSEAEPVTQAQVEIEITELPADSIVRVQVRETRPTGRFTVLNDLLKHPEQEQGIYRNHGFRLVVQKDQSADGTQPAHIDFLYDSGVRASADLICQSVAR